MPYYLKNGNTIYRFNPDSAATLYEGQLDGWVHGSIHLTPAGCFVIIEDGSVDRPCRVRLADEKEVVSVLALGDGHVTEEGEKVLAETPFVRDLP